MFGIGESIRGIEPFFPRSPITSTIYDSLDASGQSRIPSTFQNAHAYAFAMVYSLPILFGAWSRSDSSRSRKFLLLAGMGAALLGILMAATRLGMIGAAVAVVLASLSGKLGALKRVVWGLGIVAVVWGAMHNERVAGSVNRTFLEVLTEYPIGNGLGGGGTSIPYFLASQVNRPIEVENDYARIQLEQGVVGLFAWIGFVGWFMFSRGGLKKHPWQAGRRMAWFLCIFTFAMGMIGNGMLSAIPGTFMTFLFVGWTAVQPSAAPAESAALAPRTLSPSPAAAASIYGAIARN